MKPNFLNGIRFADLTWAGAGPFGTKIFSDFGAEVIKVESMTRPDPVRQGGPFKNGEAGTNRSGYFASRNTGKKSIAVNLKTVRGRDLVLDLIRSSDVLSSNFGPGAMERLGLGYEDVRKVKPDIIYLSMPMYGEDGPRASMLGVGMTISAVTALTWLTSYGAGAPVGPGTHYPDHAANPYHAAFAVLAALRFRRQTGRGMKIDLAQVESTLNFVGPAIVEQGRNGIDPVRTGNRSSTSSPHNIFRCSGDDNWCAIAVEKDSEWLALTGLMARPDLAADAGLRTSAGRLARIEEVESAVSAWTAERSSLDIVRLLQVAGIPAAVVASARHLVESDEQLQSRDFFQVLDHPEIGESVFTSPPYRIDGERVQLDRPPLFGEHTNEVLTNILGLESNDIEELRKTGVLQ